MVTTRRRASLLALACAGWLGGVEAQPVSTPDLSEILRHARFTIREFVVEGNTLVPTPELQAVLAPFRGSGRNFDDIDSARKAVLDAYARAGYELVSVDYEAARSRDGIHRLRVREVRVANVRVTGLAALTEPGVRAQLPALKEGETPRLDHLSRELALFNDNPGRSATMGFAAAEERGTVDVELRVKEAEQTRTQLTYANTGTPETGRSRVGASWSHFNLFDAAHQATFGVGTSVQEPQKVFQLAAGYLVPLPRYGDALAFGATYSNVKVGRVSDVFNVAGVSKTWSARYVRNVVRTENVRHILEFGYDERRYQDIVDFSGTNIGAAVTAKPVSVAYRYQRSWSGAAVGLGASWQGNIPGGSRNDDASYAASRAGADAHWSSAQMDLSWAYALKGGWTLSARAAGQYAREPLVSTEQYGLGGAGAVRGFTEREAAGDRGIRGSVEFLTPRMTPEIGGEHQFLAFLDAGRSSRLNPQPGEIAGEQVCSYGLGWRLSLGEALRFNVDVARVADGTLNSPSGTTKVHASAALRF